MVVVEEVAQETAVGERAAEVAHLRDEVSE